MIDQCIILLKSGIVLWSHQFIPVKGNPVDDLIRQVLLEERGGDASFESGNYSLKWTISNELDLIFVVIYQKILQLLYVDELLQLMKEEFGKMLMAFPVEKRDFLYPMESFDKPFQALMKQAESNAALARKAKQAPAKFEDTKKYQNTRQAQKDSAVGKGKRDKDEEEEEPLPMPSKTAAAAANDEDDDSVAANIARLNASGRGKGGKGRGRGSAKDVKSPKEKEEAPKPKGKEKRSWDVGMAGEANPKEKRSLDYSNKSEASGQDVASKVEKYSTGGPVNLDAPLEDSDDEEEEEEEEEEEAEGAVAAKGPAANGAKKGKGMFAMFSGLARNKPLDREDLEPAMAKFKDGLVSKNVAQEISESLCDSVCSNLEGKKAGNFTRISSTVREALEDSLTRILTPRRRIDVLADVADAKANKRPYVITFVGVNGVGKSTSLSKECQHMHNPGLGYDCVLVDTAGRMQDNEPLMRALSKLVNMNNPDLVLFVGEALVGNDAVDQVVKFNQALDDLSGSPNPRLIDGMFLTKFDTIDDKVGAALSLVYATGKPIVFVGVGQTYGDIRNLNVKMVVKALLK